jgi:hypothetical protein
LSTRTIGRRAAARPASANAAKPITQPASEACPVTYVPAELATANSTSAASMPSRPTMSSRTMARPPRRVRAASRIAMVASTMSPTG